MNLANVVSATEDYLGKLGDMTKSHKLCDTLFLDSGYYRFNVKPQEGEPYKVTITYMQNEAPQLYGPDDILDGLEQYLAEMKLDDILVMD